jgi:glycosyltransferase involved in cell wall biosynthesis
MPGRVLVITYFFPPVGGVGVQRTLKHVTYLPRWGWQPIVVAPRDPAYQLRDPSLLASVAENLEVHRTLSLEPTRLTQAVRRRLGRSTIGDGSETRVLSVGALPGEGRDVRQGALRAIASIWSRAWAALLFPEEAVAWFPFGVLSAVRAARHRRVDVLYSSSPPVTAHLIAGLTKWATGRPWVADFRDPWVGNAFAPHASRVRLGWQVRTERWIVSHADAVVVAVESMRDDFRVRYPDRAERFVHIPNGHDRAELVELPEIPAPGTGRFRIVFAGSLYRDHELETFLSGLEVLLVRRPDLKARLTVEFVGRINEANVAVAGRHADRLRDMVNFRGFVPRREALAWMASADALLQLMPAETGAGVFVGGKLLEYLAFDRPILAVMPDGEGRRIVDGLVGGRSAALDPDNIATALESLVDDPPAAGTADPTGRYDRANLAGELARVLDDVLASSRSSARG